MFNRKASSNAKHFESTEIHSIPTGFIPFSAHELATIMGGCEETVYVNNDHLNFLELSEDE